MKRAKEPQKIEMMLAPQDDVVEIVAGGDGGAGHQQQHLMQGIHDPVRLPVVRKLGKTLDEKRQTRPGKLVVQRTKIENLHDGAPRIKAPAESHLSVNPKSDRQVR